MVITLILIFEIGGGLRVPAPTVAPIHKDNWSIKAIRRKTTGTGRMRYLRHLPRRNPSCTQEEDGCCNFCCILSFTVFDVNCFSSSYSHIIVIRLSSISNLTIIKISPTLLILNHDWPCFNF
ncbi:hypothetical protein IEQ34_009720 [Dendrobium chrysotoxum]|uniref:Secreted protein n=1 Tax=Dendrobium chrysotoxum TaxID=161865 RepID=A0AAV7H1J4_DENCH|nr:hypothetical protein IEQ34_009720 [Dendrobium chrysotoxum]